MSQSDRDVRGRQLCDRQRRLAVSKTCRRPSSAHHTSSRRPHPAAPIAAIGVDETPLITVAIEIAGVEQGSNHARWLVVCRERTGDRNAAFEPHQFRQHFRHGALQECRCARAAINSDCRLIAVDTTTSQPQLTFSALWPIRDLLFAPGAETRRHLPPSRKRQEPARLEPDYSALRRCQLIADAAAVRE